MTGRNRRRVYAFGSPFADAMLNACLVCAWGLAAVVCALAFIGA